MKKLAIFTEGGTEQAFAELLLTEVAGSKNIDIRKTKLRGGGKRGNVRGRLIVEYSGTKGNKEYFAMIVDCGADNRVTSDVRDHYERLCEARYDCVIGMRDLRGNDNYGNRLGINDLPRIVPLLGYGVPRKPIDTVWILAVMETEAWFLAEYTHFYNIDPSLTLDRIITTIHFDPSTGDVEQRPEPAEDLNAVYKTAGKQYIKEPGCIQRTIEALDYATVFWDLPRRVPRIRPLIEAVNSFLT